MGFPVKPTTNRHRVRVSPICYKRLFSSSYTLNHKPTNTLLELWGPISVTSFSNSLAKISFHYPSLNPMWRAVVITKLARQMCRLEIVRVQTLTYCSSTVVGARSPNQSNGRMMSSDDAPPDTLLVSQYSRKDAKEYAGEKFSKRNRINLLVTTLINLKDNKEDIYGTLDAWIAWERDFPIGSIKNAILALEKEHQWHKVVQVLKWMLSKGQGTTMGTYEQLIRALDMDNRAGEAHEIWVKKVGRDLHSVPWKFCKLMISVYYKNDMLEELVKLFKGMEAFDRKLREKTVLRKVADSYEKLGLPEEKENVLEKYKNLLIETQKGHHPKGSRRFPS